MGRLRFVGAAAAAALGMVALPLTAVTTMADQSPVSRYQHIFYIVEENHEFSQIIGNPSAPNLNAFASSNGLSTSYFGTSHPSEPNYVAMIG
ncbi:MAG: phosphoesterase, partial [Actinobacteria bacterium]|nr:phosphoesterase [Actinomycetota bacterium]